MRGLRTDRTATVIIAGLAIVQNLRRGHYELAIHVPAPLRSRPRSPSWYGRSNNGSRRGRAVPGHPERNGATGIALLGTLFSNKVASDVISGSQRVPALAGKGDQLATAVQAGD
jgi:hypothetical protein